MAKRKPSKARPPRTVHFRTPRVFSTALFGALFTIAASLTAIGGLLALSGNEEQAERAIYALSVNLILVITLGVYLIIRLRAVFFKSEEGRNAPRLHRRFIFIFSLAALVPAILVGLFFTALMSRNLSDVFGPTVRQTMQNSRSISNVYLGEEIEKIKASVRDTAGDLNRERELFPNRITFTAFLINQAVFRQLPVVYVIDESGQILAQAEGRGAPDFTLPSDEVMNVAKNGSITVTSRNEIDMLVAVYKLQDYDNAYLYAGSYLRSGLLGNIDRIDEVEKSLDSYSGSFKDLNRVFLLTYIEVALLVFFAAVWLGLVLANRIVSPLGAMVNAAEKVRSGDLAARVNVTGVWDEVGDLANAFNRMTKQLQTQRDDLVLEHDISEQRREFSEAVLSGVSAGVIGLTPEGKITLINKSAENLLGLRTIDVVGSPISLILEGFLPAFNRAKDDIYNEAEDQVNLETPRGTRNLDIRVSSYKGDQPDTGWVITFDDITRLVAAQRHSAWREVARRIAHEIKNPLTPIQLSAERLERKYKAEITNDPEVFSQCTQTIIRQVSNLGRMVDEFSAFARMPAPILEPVSLRKLLEETIFAQRVAFPDVQFLENDIDKEVAIEIFCDERLISQALTNIYKNAGESIYRRIGETSLNTQDGAIQTTLSTTKDLVTIDVIDNGQGWPLQDRERLLEPYMTTRAEGSGLGLAIVKRIIEDHGGTLELVAIQEETRGAHVRIKLPRTDDGFIPPIPEAHTASSLKTPRKQET